MKLDALNTIQTPAYVADIAAIKRNMDLAARIKREAGVSMVLATKAFAMPAVFPFMRDTLDGSTASGLYEARLGFEHFGKDVHTYSPAYSAADLDAVTQYSGHIYFNSVEQLMRFSPIVRARRTDAKIGLRVNPQLSLVKNSELYDPSAPCSRFGVLKGELTQDVLDTIDILHVHNLCENMAEDSVALINHLRNNFAFALEKISHLNLGGGHFYSHPDYNVDALIAALKSLSADFDVHVTLEPGAAHVLNAGYLVGSVLDVIKRDSASLAILDASASTHMPDVLEVPYRPNIIGSGLKGEKAHDYILGGNTCMTGDVIGEYSFDAPLQPGQKLIFTDMMQYSFVKNTTFNGVPLPDLALLHEDGRYEVIKRFGYEDFFGRLSAL